MATITTTWQKNCFILIIIWCCVRVYNPDPKHNGRTQTHIQFHLLIECRNQNAENGFRWNEWRLCALPWARPNTSLRVAFSNVRFTQTYLYKTEQQTHTIRLSFVVIHLVVVATGKKYQIQIFCFLCLSLCRNWKINDIFWTIFQTTSLCACLLTVFYIEVSENHLILFRKLYNTCGVSRKATECTKLFSSTVCGNFLCLFLFFFGLGTK